MLALTSLIETKVSSRTSQQEARRLKSRKEWMPKRAGLWRSLQTLRMHTSIPLIPSHRLHNSNFARMPSPTWISSQELKFKTGCTALKVTSTSSSREAGSQMRFQRGQDSYRFTIKILRVIANIKSTKTLKASLYSHRFALTASSNSRRYTLNHRIWASSQSITSHLKDRLEDPRSRFGWTLATTKVTYWFHEVN